MALLTSVPLLWSPAINPAVSSRRSQELCVLTSHTHLCQSSCWLRWTLLRIPCQLEFSNIPHPCSIFTRSESDFPPELWEKALHGEPEHFKQVFVWPQGPKEEDNQQQITPCPLGRMHLVQKSESLMASLMFVWECCAFSSLNYSA